MTPGVNTTKITGNVKPYSHELMSCARGGDFVYGNISLSTSDTDFQLPLHVLDMCSRSLSSV